MGSKIVYYLLLLPFSKLPLGILYLFSNFIFFVMYRIVGYRKKVVLQNIENSFPDKKTKEHKEIMLGFYRHFCDLIIESVKCFSLSKKEALKRFVLKNPELLDQFYKENKDVIFVGGHYSNWELSAISVPMQMQHEVLGIYKPLSNKLFDDKMRKSREKYGLNLCPTYNVKQKVSSKGANPKGTIFLFDQSPSNPKKSYWMHFLSQETPMLFGAEKYAKEHNLPVIYFVLEKEKRGYYSGTMRLIASQPKETEHGEITKAINLALEKDIMKAPEYWLWSHKRWKHKRPKDVPLN